MKVICIYDNHIAPNVFIKNIIGEKTFGEVILKRKSIKDKFLQFIKKQDSISEVIEMDHDWQIEALLNKMKSLEDIHIIHFFSNFVIMDEMKVRILIQKAMYIQENYLILSEGAPALFMMDKINAYCEFLKYYSTALELKETYFNNKLKERFEVGSTDAFLNLSVYNNFLQYISGGFDTRYFNSVTTDEYIVTKTSEDKRKIKAEYQFYHLLPDEMKMWFVMPYNYRENNDCASYDMERYHMTDLAIRWVHGAITLDELNVLLKKIFYFLNMRARKNQDKENYEKCEYDLYIKKVEERISKLKEHKKYAIFSSYIVNGTEFADLDAIIDEYRILYKKIRNRVPVEYYSVIGHGDLCFSNMLFNKDTDLIKLIDPKGALEEKELWMNPYYDIAKLSHSICGKYDFFNNGLFHLSLDAELKFVLEIDFDNTNYKKLFKEYVEMNNFSYDLVRIYEVSLFLSMLPLHMDNPQKVFGFILNTINILKELKEHV